MHHTCVMSTEPGGDLFCPICKSEFKLDKLEETTKEVPYWHEAAFGTVLGRKARVQPEVGLTLFPTSRWPTLEEASLYGYKTLLDWYVDHRQRDKGCPNLGMLEIEFADLEKRMKGTVKADPEDEEAVARVAPLDWETDFYEGVLGGMAAPCGFADVEP